MLSLTATSIKRPTSPKLGRLNGNPPDFYVHPSLYLHHEPSSGNAAQARKPLQAGTLLLIDSAYASIPLVPPGSNNRPLCSRLQCSRKITRSASTVVCPKLCAHEVVWCNSECRRLSSAQHDYECAWLSTHSQNIREGCGERDFYMLWLVVRILASRHLEMRFPQSETSLENNSFTSSWDALCRLRSNEGTQQPLKLEYWRGLVREYLMGEGSMLPGSLNEDDMLTLMCREETNNFDLLPGLIGVWPLPSFEDRGEPYSWGMYLRAVFFNHACIPNVSFANPHFLFLNYPHC